MNPLFMFEDDNGGQKGGGLTARQSVEGIARKTKVPANVLLALGETAGAKSPDELVAIAERAAAELGPRLAAGEDIQAVIRDTAGDKADAFMSRAREIGESLYPKQMAKLKGAKPTKEGGLGAAIGVGVDQIQQATGSVIEGIGRSTGMEGLAEYGAGVADRNRQEIEEGGAGLTRLGDVDGVGSAAKFTGETLAQQVPQLGLSMGAAATGAAIGTAVLPGLGTAAGAVGGMIGGTLVNLPFFYGMNRERQKEANPAEGVDELKALVAAAPQAALDTFGDMLIGGVALKPAAKGLTGIFTKAVPREVAEKAGMKILGRAAGGAAMGGMVEVPTEIGQSVIERAQAGLPLWDEDARREYLETGVAAGIVGGTVGGAAGAMGRHEPGVNVEEPPRPEEQAQGGAAPAEQPTLALPAPEAGGTIFGDGPTRDPAAFERQPGDYRAGDPTQQPAQFRPGGTLRTALNAGVAAQAPAAQAPVAPTMRGAASMAPGEIIPGMQPGTPVSVWTPDGNPIGGTFTAQTPLAVTVTTNDGEVLEIPRSEFDALQVAISPAYPPEPGPALERPPAIREGEKPIVQTGKVEPQDPPAAAESEPQPQGAGPTPPAPVPAEPTARATGDFSDLSPEEARKRIAIIEDQARARGWDARLRGIHDQLKAVADADMLAANAAAQEASKIQPAVIAKKDGTPFKSEEQARRALVNQRRDPAAYRIEPRDGGFVAAPFTDQDTIKTQPADAAAEIGEMPENPVFDQVPAPAIQEEAAGEAADAPATGPVGPEADGAAVLSDGARVGEVPAQDRGAVEEGRPQDQAVPEEPSPNAAGIAPVAAPVGDMDGAAADAEPAPALTGEIITPEDDAIARKDAAASVGIDLQPPPVPQSAPWWDAADADTRKAILREAGPAAEREHRKAMTWGGMSEDGRRALTDAYGRLYRAGTIRNAGTIEAPKPALALPPGAPPSALPAPSQAKPAPVTAETKADAQTVEALAARWDALPAPEREALVAKAGWSDKTATAPNRTGRKIAGRSWAEQPDSTKATLALAAAKAPVPADQVAGAGKAMPEASSPTVADIRERAAVLRGVPKDAPPAVPGVSLKWDEREGGFIFSRKHRPAVEQAMGLAEAKAAPPVEPRVDTPQPQPQQKESTSGQGMQEGRQGREEVAQPKPKTEAPQKRPLIYHVRKSIGQIDPDGPAGRELYHRGVNAQAAPGLFRRGGLKDLDNIPASEHPDVAAAVGVADDGIYLDQGRMIEAMADEIGGTPAPLGNQVGAQIDAAAYARAMKKVIAEAPADPGPEAIVAPSEDMSPDADRYRNVIAAVARAIDDLGISGALTEAERSSIIEDLFANGGEIDTAIEQAITRSYLNAAFETADPSGQDRAAPWIPFFGDERDGGPRRAAEAEGGSRPVEDRDGGVAEGAPREEVGADGKPQLVIPGAEASDAQRKQALTDRQRLEMQAKQQQSKMRRLGGNGGDAGPLFADQKDLLDAAAAPERPPARKKSPKQVASEREAKIRDYFTPGNVVPSYGGKADIVLTYEAGEDGRHTVTVQEAKQEGDRWVADPEERVRTHGTLPDDRELARGPLQRAEVKPDQAEAIAAAAAKADPNPTEAEKAAGNYAMGHASWNGLGITIETAKGAERRGKDRDGEEWSVKMPAHYGYINRTEGADGDHVDFYMGDMPDSDFVLIVNQVDAETGKWDEHKVILGTGSTSAALGIYEAGFSDGKGRQRIGSFTATSVEGFKNWLAAGDLTKPTEPVKKREAAQKPAPEAEPGPEAATKPADVADAAPVAADRQTREERIQAFEDRIDALAAESGLTITAADRTRIKKSRGMSESVEDAVARFVKWKAIEDAGPAKAADLSVSAGESAYRNTSHNPERRAEEDIRSYVEDVNEIYADMLKLAATEDQKRVLDAQIERYKAGYLKHQNAMWAAQGRTASWFITGAAKFPTARNEKRLRTEEKRSKEFLEWHAKARAAMRRAITDARPDEAKADDAWRAVERDVLGTIATLKGIETGDIRGSDPALFKQNLQGRIERLAKNGESDLVNRALALLRAAPEKFGLKKPVFTDRSSIWKLGDAAAAKAERTEAAIAAGPSVVATFDGAEITRDPGDDRVRIRFDERVSREIADALKAEGWKWSPSNAAWQRKNTNAAVYSAQRIVGKFFKQAEPEAATANDPEIPDGSADTAAEMREGLADAKPITASDLAPIASAVQAEVARLIPGGKVTARVVRGLLNAAGVPILGRQRGAQIEVAATEDAKGVARHEIGHAMRDPDLWGTPYGLFTRDEWVGLVKDARQNPEIVAAVEKAYRGRPASVQTEEMVMERWRLYAEGIDARGAAKAALDKIKALFQAFANALRGRGFQSEALTFERMAAGKIGRRALQARGPDGRFAAQDTVPHEMRTPISLADAIVAGDLGSATGHPDYAAAKAGDVAAAVRVARDLVTDDLVKRVREALGSRQPIVVPVVSEEAAGRNKIPRAAAEVLAMRLGVEAATGVVQANSPRRTALAGLDRIFASPEFDGPVLAGQDYLLVDDTLTQGATFAALASYIEAGGGRVVGSVALTGKQYSAKLALSPETLQALRDKHGDLEPDFIRATGHGFDALTESEARYLARFKPAESVRDRILAEGRRGRASADQGDAQGLNGREMRADLIRPRGQISERGLISQLLTDAMGGKGRANLLALVPGEPLLAELGKRLPSIGEYLNLKHAMGAERNERQAKADEVAQRWRKAMHGKDGHKQNQAMMDLMHESTIARVDPSKPFAKPRRGPNEGASAYAARIVAGQEAHAGLKAKFDALPEQLQSIYREVRDFYRDMADAEERAVLENVRVAMSVNLQRAQRAYDDEVQRIRDDGLEGAEYAEAMEAAQRKLTTVKRTAGWGASARISALRSVFESNRIEGPYFPLGRFGNYFVTVRDADGKVVSFSKFESEREQQAFAAEQKKTGARVQMGVMTDAAGKMREMIDPTFVADIEKLVGDAGKDDALMDAIWQRYLETMPDLSIRKSRLHRKGTEGFARDAFRVFGVKAFHGAHQIARLRFGMKMTNELEKAEIDADKTDDPNRAKLVVNEILRRHEFTMNPKSSAWSAWASSAAFVYYLGATPAAAMVNLSQTTVVGVPVMLARFKKANVVGVTRELLRAGRDFFGGKFHAADSKRLAPDEKRALAEAYRRGIIDKSQSHDLAGIAEAGAEYSDLRARMMKPIAFMFHHAERMNREITFLAAYRLAKAEGQSPEAAIETSGRVTWDTHFNYESDARPRLLQQDWLRVAMTFRNFQINMLYRLFRDMHQMMRGRTADERKEARTQLIGITASMMLHAGITGTWGYALMTTLLGMFDDDGADGVEEEIKEGLIGMFGPEIAGLFLKGVPGHLSGIDLTSRLGMPALWFRAPDRQMEGEDLYAYWVEQTIGPVVAIGASIFTGVSLAADGNVYRGVETAVPKFIRDAMKGYRYMTEGVTTRKGDVVLEDVSPAQAITQALGFSPAQVSERYEINGRRMNAQKRIEDDRSEILNEITKALRAGERPSRAAFDRVAEFNRAHPQFAITGDTIRRSLKSRVKAGQDISEGGGIRLNDKLEREITARFGAASLYQ